MDSPRLPPRLRAYASNLQKVSLRTGTPLTSLAVSFAILHEITAIAPLVGIYWGARTLGVGKRMKDHWNSTNAHKQTEGHSESQEASTSNVLSDALAHWTKEGERRVARVGARYGILGFEKGQPVTEEDMEHLGGRVAIEVANGAFAYMVVKVCFGTVFHVFKPCYLPI